MWISLATVAHNFLVFARTDPHAEQPHAGLSASVVEREMKGVTTGDIHGKLGVRAGSTGWINLADVEVPAANRLGEEGEGFKIAMSCLDNGRYTVAAGATGLIRCPFPNLNGRFRTNGSHHRLADDDFAGHTSESLG